MSDVPPRPRIRPATSDDWEPTDRSGRGAQARPQGSDRDANPADADFDRSTYYEYIERHTGDFPVSQTRRANVFAPAGSSPFQDHLHAGAREARESEGSRDSRSRSGGRSGPRRGGGPSAASDSGGFGAVGGSGSAPGYGSSGYGYGASYGTGPGGVGPGGPESGQAPAVGPKRTGLKVTVVVLAILMVLALLAFFGARWLAPDSGTVPVDVGGEATSQAPSPSDELVRPSSSPEDELDGFVQSDASKASALEGQWVTQVSAKKVGIEADGKTWSAQDILDEFKANQVKYPGSILIYSGDWKAYKSGDYWVTVVDTPYKDSKPALEQCRAWGLDRDHCLAKRLVKDGEYSEKNSAYLDK